MSPRILSILMFSAVMFLQPGHLFAGGEKDTATFTVSGNCDMCKTRIEAGAKKGGANKANWNLGTHVIQVIFDPAKTTVGQIQQGIAGAGYDTEKYKSSLDAYQKLPLCCQYERQK
jgi:periplasmic mercuric ion binding protein